MPSGYTTALPTSLGLGVGVLYYNSTTVFGVSDGGIRCVPEIVRENIPFDNKASDIQGLDVDWEDRLRISGEFIQITNLMLSADLIEPGATPTTAGTPATVTYQPYGNNALYVDGDYISNLVYEITFGDGTKKRWIAPKAMVAKYEIIGQHRKAHRISCEFISKLASADAATSTDKKSYKIEQVAAA